jgi:hypothetical protein
MRNITIASTGKGSAKVIRSGVETWGGLKDVLGSEFGNLSQMRAVVRETRNDLQSDDAILPEGDFTLLLNTMHIKAGVTDVDVVKILEGLKSEFFTAIDNIIMDIEDGDFDLPKVVTKAVNSSKALSSDLQKDLAKLAEGKL